MGRIGNDAREHLERLSKQYPEIEAEYQRLGPRYAAISALIAARKRRGLTQTQLAQRMGVAQSVVARLESGAQSPKVDTLASAAAAMDLDLEVRFSEPARPRSTRRRSRPEDTAA